MIVQARVSSAQLAKVCFALGLTRSEAVRRALDLLEGTLYDASDAASSQRQVNRAPGPLGVSPSSTPAAPGPVAQSAAKPRPAHSGSQDRPSALFTPTEQDDIESLLKELGE